MELHCYDGPPGPDPKKPEKKEVRVSTIQELRFLVEKLIETGRTDLKLHFDQSLMHEEEFYEIMGMLVEKHPKVSMSSSEVVSYSEENFGSQVYKGHVFRVEPFEGGFRVLRFTPCGSQIPSFDITFQTPEEAEAHAKSEIDLTLENTQR